MFIYSGKDGVLEIHKKIYSNEKTGIFITEIVPDRVLFSCNKTDIQTQIINSYEILSQDHTLESRKSK